VNAARIAAAALLATSPALPGGAHVHGGESRTPVPLRATLRAAAPGPAPAWLEQTVCDRGIDLGPACSEVARAVAEEARAAGLDPVLMLAVIEVESAWDPHASSNRDAHGLMQLQPPTLADEAADGQLPSTNPHDPLVNVRAGIRYLGRMLERFGDPELALVAYNAGPNRLATYLEAERGVPDRFWEYPRLVHRAERRLRASLGRPAQLVAARDPTPPPAGGGLAFAPAPLVE
jgi:soluble lytic murein transglycosylase-like protein